MSKKIGVLKFFFQFFAVATENSNCSTEATVSPSVSKTPQKSQLTKILDKVKKEQQLKGEHRALYLKALAMIIHCNITHAQCK